jgi:hypothetical protein
MLCRRVCLESSWHDWAILTWPEPQPLTSNRPQAGAYWQNKTPKQSSFGSLQLRELVLVPLAVV